MLARSSRRTRRRRSSPSCRSCRRPTRRGICGVDAGRRARHDRLRGAGRPASAMAGRSRAARAAGSAPWRRSASSIGRSLPSSARAGHLRPDADAGDRDRRRGPTRAGAERAERQLAVVRRRSRRRGPCRAAVTPSPEAAQRDRRGWCETGVRMPIRRASAGDVGDVPSWMPTLGVDRRCRRTSWRCARYARRRSCSRSC